MIIQYVLVAGLLVSLLYALTQRRRSRLVTVAIGITSLTGVYFVVVPEQTQNLAHWVGVGRGADLVMYCWIVISLVVSLSLYFRILRVESGVTALVRELALRAPVAPQTEHDAATGAERAPVPPPA